MEDDLINSMIEMITPVMEGAMVTAAHYTKACGRTTVTAMDMKYGMRFGAQHLTGKHIGTMFPELQGSDSDDSDIEEVEEDDEPFTRYTGDDELMIKVNKSYDEWDSWVPYSPLEKMIKNAVDHSG